jgi:hypothetical protein
MIPWGLLGLEGIPRGCAVLSLIYDEWTELADDASSGYMYVRYMYVQWMRVGAS